MSSIHISFIFIELWTDKRVYMNSFIPRSVTDANNFPTFFICIKFFGASSKRLNLFGREFYRNDLQLVEIIDIFYFENWRLACDLYKVFGICGTKIELFVFVCYGLRWSLNW